MHQSNKIKNTIILQDPERGRGLYRSCVGKLKEKIYHRLMEVLISHMELIHFRLQITSCDCNITASVVLEALHVQK